MATVRELITTHEQAGRLLDVAGVATFVREQPATESPETPLSTPVLCLHGVPVSSFLYRHVQPALAAHGLPSLAVDLPGMGLSARPDQFDYSWSGLGAHLAATVQALDLPRVHLVVHDIGGPVGFELAARLPERIASLVLLDTIVQPHTFHRPWTMAPFAVPGLAPWVLRGTYPAAFRLLTRLHGIADNQAVDDTALNAHLHLLRRGDDGRAFLKIMRGFELTQAKTDLYQRVLRDPRYPTSIIWAREDPALRLNLHGELARQAADVEQIVEVPGKHFPHEDHPQALADAIAAAVRTAESPA